MNRKTIPSKGIYSFGVIAVLILAALACNAGSTGTAPTATSIITQATPLPGTTPGAPQATPTTAATATPVTPSPTPTTVCTYDSIFVSDITIPDGTEIVTGAPFTKTWRLKNNGCLPWENGTVLIFVNGNQMSGPISVPVPATAVNGTQDISVSLKAPSTAGEHTGYWQLRAPDGIQFGDKIYVKIKAVDPTPTSVPPTATPTSILPVLTLAPGLTLLPLLNLDFTAGYAGTWACGSTGMVSFQIINKGTLDIESMSYSIEGPTGTVLNSAMQNKPFRSSPSVGSPACSQAGAEKLAVSASGWVYLVANSPGPGVSGKATFKMCGLDDLAGFCKTVTSTFTY
jgi:hypothetical protein